MKLPPNKHHPWRVYQAVKVGTVGTVKDGYGPLSGKQVMHVGMLNGYHWLKLLEDAPGYPRGSTFTFLLKWVDWPQ